MKLSKNEKQKLILKRVAFMAKCGKTFDQISITLKKDFGIGQKYSFQRIPDKLLHYLYDCYLFFRHGGSVDNIGNAYESMVSFDSKFAQHPIHRGFFYDKSRHALVGTITGIDLNASNGKHHFLELNRSTGLLEIIRPIYKTKYGPEIYNVVNFAKEHGFKKVYFMYSRLHLYKKEFIDASAEFGIEMIPVSYPWVEFDKKKYKHYFMPDTLEKDTLYMRIEPGYSPIMHYLSDKYVSYKWLRREFENYPEKYSLINIPETSNYARVNKSNNSDKWPDTVIKLSGKMQGQAIFMLKADTEEKLLQALNIKNKYEMPSLFKASFTEKIVDKLFGYDQTVIYQDFVQPALKDGIAGRIRINVFANPLKSFSISDYYMWTVFEIPDICPKGLIDNPKPYVVNWAFSGKQAQFAELTVAERDFLDPAIPQICQIIQNGMERKFESRG